MSDNDNGVQKQVECTDDPTQPDKDKKLHDADDNFRTSRERMVATGAMHVDTHEGKIKGALNPEHEEPCK